MKVRRLLLLLVLPTLAIAQQQYYGTTAAGIRLSEPYEPEDQDKIQIRAGQTITQENIRAAIQALYDTGHYRYVEVDTVATPAGTQLTFNVTPHFFFSTLRLDNENLLDRALSSSLRVPVGEKFSTALVQRIIEETTQLLEDAGYFNAVVTPELAYDNSTRLVRVTLKTMVKTRAKVGSIEIRGGDDTFTPAKQRNTLGLSTGDDFSADEIDKGTADIRKSFTDLGFLNTKIAVDRNYDAVANTVNLAITIEPGQFAYVQPRGYEIKKDQLRELVPVYEEGAYDPDLIKEGKERILEYLQRQGYFEAAVADPEVIPAPLDNAVQINYTITPGAQHKIGTIQIYGGAFFPEAELKRRMKIRGSGFLDSGSFSPALLTTDTTTIKTMYRRAGFEDVIVEGRENDNTEHSVDVIIEITEGARYPIEKLVFSGHSDMTEEELRSHLAIKEGDVYSPAEAENARTALMETYYAMGYPDVRVEAAADRNPATGAKTITFQISEGMQYQIGKIIVAGNTRTAEKIIHRNSGLYTNIPYNPEMILEAQQRLYSTGLFNRVEIVTLDQDADHRRNLLIQVEDAKAIMVTPGVGAKEYDGPRITLDVSHNNLWGLDRSLSMRMRGGLHERQLQMTYREPRLFNHNLEGYGTLSFEKSKLRFYEAQRFDVSIQILKRLSLNKSFRTTASYQAVDLQDIRYNPIARRVKDCALRDERNECGIVHIARLGAEFVGDWRDDSINPQRGHFSRNTFEVASRVWGSEVNFVSAYNQTTYYRQAPGGVVALSSRLGLKKPYGKDDELPITERYFAGGSTTLRGFDLDEAGARGGGQLMTIGNVEYRAPIKLAPISGIGAALFYDTGTVFERPADFSLSDFTHSAGAGIRYQTPLGPVRFDVGFNLHPITRLQDDGSSKRDERVQVFFTLGHTF